MKLKGDLESIGLAELFQTLASQRATGVLSVSGPNGQKTIALASGEIAVVSDKFAERTRLGDVLIARGRLTEEQLNSALKEQRGSSVRMRLGDTLIKLGFIREEDIEDSLKFQFEEELFDLFTWKQATFEFDGDRSIEDAIAENATGNTQRMHIDPQEIIAEAGRRMTEWKEVESRLPTPYLCFKLTPKGEEFSTRANTATQQIMKLLKEGRTIETTVKRSCMGRFNVCKAIMKLLDEGWIFPYPSSELRMLASDHRTHNRFSDALYIYRRLLDSAQSDDERTELESAIEETLQSIRQAAEAGEVPEGVETVSYKEAAERFKTRQRQKRIVTILVCGTAIIVSAVSLTQHYQPPKSFSDDYRDALSKADEAIKEHKYEDAARIWESFLDRKVKDRTSDTAYLIEERLRNLPLQSTSHMERVLKPFEAAERAERFDEALAGYQRLLKQFPENPLAEKMKEGVARLESRMNVKREETKKTDLKNALQNAFNLMEQKQYTASRREYLKILPELPEGSKEREEYDRAMKKFAELETKATENLAEADKELKEKKAEKAIEIYDQVAGEWPELDAAKTAKAQSQRLKKRLEQLKQDITEFEAVVSRRSLLQAMENLKQLERDYAEFESISVVKQRISELSRKMTAVDNRIEHAKTLIDEGDKAAAKKVLIELMKEQPAMLVARKVEVPVNITSYPPGAAITLNGKSIGVTPLEARIPIAAPFTLRYERQGYEPLERKLEKLPDDLELTSVRLKRDPINILQFKPTITAPPLIVNGEMFVLHGPSLSVVDDMGKGTIWSLDKILEDKTETRPNPSGNGPAQFLTDRSFWYPRWPPLAQNADKYLLSLRSRDLLEIDNKARSFNKLFSFPAEPAGQMYLERQSLLNGKPILIAGFLDGKIRAFDMDKHGAAPLWERPADPDVGAPAGALLGNIVPRTSGTFMAMSANGRIFCLNVVNGQENWSVKLKSPLAEANSLPENPQQSVASFVHFNGRVSAVDLSTRETLWELPVDQAMNEVTHTAVGSDGIYVITRKGEIQKLGKERATEKPRLIWRRPIDGYSEIPLFIGKKLYVVSNFGTIYAISFEDGSVLWDYRTDSKPTHLVENGKVLYVATKEGRLLILNAE